MGVRRLIAILSFVTGALLCAQPLGLLPPIDMEIDASPQLMLGSGAVLILVGFLQLARDHKASEAMGAVFLLALAGITGWVTFLAPAGTVARVLPFIPTDVNDALARLLFGIGVAACVTMTVFGLRRLFR